MHFKKEVKHLSLLKNNHRYSYSQLSSFSECPFGYYLKHIEGKEEASNAFAEFGSLIHSILDKWAKGIITKEEMPEEYMKRYEEVVKTSFPRFLAAKGYTTKAYEMGLEYLTNFDGFPGYEVVSAEEEFDMPLKLTDGTSRPFIAYVDLVLRDEFTGGLVVMDHKSKSWAEFRKHRDEMYKQQFLYSYFVHEKYGEWPVTTAFNLFKENGKIDEREFTKEEFEATMQWATDAIHAIESYDVLDWMKCKEQRLNKKTGKYEPDMFCAEVCGQRRNCPSSIAR